MVNPGLKLRQKKITNGERIDPGNDSSSEMSTDENVEAICKCKRCRVNGKRQKDRFDISHIVGIVSGFAQTNAVIQTSSVSRMHNFATPAADPVGELHAILKAFIDGTRLQPRGIRMLPVILCTTVHHVDMGWSSIDFHGKRRRIMLHSLS
jgi:hypothetical protein